MYEGENVRRIREQKKMTGRRLAELSGYPPSFISALEHSKTNPSISTLENIAKALDVPLSAIVDETFYYPLLSNTGLKVSENKLACEGELFSELQKMWLEILNWDVNDAEELVIYLKAKQEAIKRRQNK